MTKAKAKAKAKTQPPPNKVVASGALVSLDSNSEKARAGNRGSRLRNEVGVREQIQIASEIQSETLEIENLSESAGSDGTKEVDEMLAQTKVDNVLEGCEVLKDVGVLEAKKPWVDIIKGNRQIRRGMAMEFEAPNVVDGEAEVEIGTEDIESEVEFWKAGMIIFAVGRELSTNAVKQFMEKVWNTVSLPDLYYHDQGYFLVRFKTVEDRDFVLHNGPYSIYSSPLFMCEWSAGFVLKRYLLRMMPIWIKLPNLPLRLWGERSLGKIASAIGRPISTDECTAKKLRILYARILVEVDITQESKNEIRIKEADGSIFMQKVVYEWIPDFCAKCQQIGHNCDNEQKEATKKVWKPKETITDKVEVECEKLNEMNSGGVRGQAKNVVDVVKLAAKDKRTGKGKSKEVVNQNVVAAKSGDKSVSNANLASEGQGRSYDKVP